MRDKIPLMLVTILAAMLVYGFFYFFESYDEESKVGYSKKAQRNSLLAAEQFLEGFNIDVNSKNDYLLLDQVPVETTVFLTRVDSMLLTPKQINTAVEWLQQGGNMIVGVERESASTDSLLTRFDISAELYENQDDTSFDFTEGKLSEKLKKQNDLLDKKSNDSDESSEEKVPEHKHEVSLLFTDSDKPLIIKFPDEILLNHPEILGDESLRESDLDYQLYSYAENDHGAKLMQFEVGEGFLTVLSGSELWDNQNINEADNAYFLAGLIGDLDSVNFYVNINAIPFSAILTTRFPQALLFFLVLLLLWIWQQFIRTSRIQEYQVGDRRALSEHLTASSELFSKNGRYELLLKPILNDIEKGMSAYKRNFISLERSEKVELIAKHSRIEKSVIEEWIQSLNNVNDSPTFLNAVQTGKLIRNRL